MDAKCTDGRRRGAGQGGFTMAELLIVMVLAGVLAVFIMPRMQSAVGMRDDAWRDEVVSALRHAQKMAVSHRRLVCAQINANDLTLRISSTHPADPANPCDAPLPGADGSDTYAASSSGAAATSVNPAGALFFQPDGRVTTDGAGATALSRTITMNGAPSLTVHGETGYVE